MPYLIRMSLILTIIVICLGAYTRLADAGLGCPDWPGCYGQHIPSANNTLLYNGELVLNDSKKAWIEMIHRYVAGLLGIMILVIFIKSLINRQQYRVVLASALSLLIVLQSTLGMLTVTMKLQPVIVCLHLLGGFSTLALLFIFYKKEQTIKQKDFIDTYHFMPESYFYIGCLVLFVLILQILLGGWVSANYAAPFCKGFPLCDTSEQFNIKSIYQIDLTHDSFQYGVMNEQSRMSIHLLHRFMALVTCLFIVSLTSLLLLKARLAVIKNACLILLLFLGVQITLGISLIFFQFPLSIALLHNLIAAGLLISLINVLFELKNRCFNSTLALNK